MIRIFTDAAYNPKTKEAGLGVVLFVNQSRFDYHEFLPQAGDNHEAEFTAVQLAMQQLGQHVSHQDEVILLHCDSKIVIQSLDKQYAKQEAYHLLLKKSLNQIAQYPNFYWKWIPEKENLAADQVARHALHKKLKR
ncbi:ribonuclease HI family protein [Vaginisenegalia massiliensis]|uniref:ribonuclease HI family protein n=1 Tax=Vaginisenegalia massiliensis TaxID=2058294 RepID=UPI000F5457C3|nr:ribonuclease HI family protein [Vaginisenegalia massiliensis]